MRFVEFVNFSESEMPAMRDLFRRSDSMERWVEWRKGLRGTVPAPDISIINAAGISNVWHVKKLADLCSGKVAALFGTDREMLGLPVANADRLIESISAMLVPPDDFMRLDFSHSFGQALTCPTPLTVTPTCWEELSSQKSVPSYAQGKVPAGR